MVPVESLKKFKIFQDAPMSQLEKLSKDMSEKSFSQGDVICKEDEAGGALYLISSGSVAVEKKAFQEEEGSKVVARLEMGEFFGEMAFLQGVPHSATVVAQEPTTILMFSRAALDELMKKNPKTALEQVLTVSMGLSNRLRSTTRELVTVYETARAVGSALSIDELAKRVLGQLSLDLGPNASMAFYRWNIFNDEYALVFGLGHKKGAFPPTLEPSAELSFEKGQLLVSRIDMLNEREGLCIYYSQTPDAFLSGERQMMETVSAVLAPALAATRHREEEASRAMLQRGKQSFSL